MRLWLWEMGGPGGKLDGGGPATNSSQGGSSVLTSAAGLAGEIALERSSWGTGLCERCRAGADRRRATAGGKNTGGAGMAADGEAAVGDVSSSVKIDTLEGLVTFVCGELTQRVAGNISKSGIDFCEAL